jgi:hypothetical protein
MKELSIDEAVLVAGGQKCGPGTQTTYQVTGHADGTSGWDEDLCDPV